MRFGPDDRGGVTVVVDGQPQSHVALADPLLLAFDYVAHLALVIDVLGPVLAPKPLRCTHIGGAAMTLPRWVQATRPGSPQIVLEPDAALTAEVRARLPLPRGHRIRVRPVGGLEGVAALAEASADVVVLDAYARGRVPAELVTVEFFASVCRVLAPGGLLAANLADEPGLRHTARVVAGIREAGLGEVVLVASHEVFKGRRFGNVVVAARRAGVGDRVGDANAAGREAGAARRRSATSTAATPAGTQGATVDRHLIRLMPAATGASPAGTHGATAHQRTGNSGRRPRVAPAGPGGGSGSAAEALRRKVASAPLPTGIRAGRELEKWLAGARPFTEADAEPSPAPPEAGSWRRR